MWQRLQTLYLALATGLVVTLFFSLKSFTIGPGGAHAEELTYVQFFPYLILLILITLLQVMAIVTFKARLLQMRTASLAGILLIALQAWLTLDNFTADDIWVFSWTAVFPVVAAICDFLAARRIFSDQLVVESLSHLRSRKKNRKII